MLKKVILALALLSVLFTVIFIYCIDKDNAISDVLKLKSVSGWGMIGYPVYYESVGHLCAASDAVINGSAMSAGEHKPMPVKLPNFEGSKERIEFYDCTFTKIKVDKVLYGDKKIADEIILSQLGKPTDNNTMIKVKNGWKMVLFLNKVTEYKEYDNLYVTRGNEQGIFVIGDKILGRDEVVSLSREKVFTKYDGESLDDLLDDIADAKTFLDPIREANKTLNELDLSRLLISKVRGKTNKN